LEEVPEIVVLQVNRADHAGLFFPNHIRRVRGGSAARRPTAAENGGGWKQHYGKTVTRQVECRNAIE
jgi:hypothetical protein